VGFPSPARKAVYNGLGEPRMNAVLEPILRSTKWDEPIDALVRARARERARRRQFIETLREDQKAEFICGEVVVHSPVTVRHNLVANRLATMLDIYTRRRGLGLLGREKLLISLSRNDYEPDIVWFASDKAAQLLPDQRRCPAPDFIAEVLSDSTEATDRGVKRVDYAAHHVTEYWIVDPDAETVEVHVLGVDEYPASTRRSSGMLISVAIPGFTIPLRAVFDDAECDAAIAAMYAPKPEPAVE